MRDAQAETAPQETKSFMAEFGAALGAAIPCSAIVGYLVGPELKIKHILSSTAPIGELEDYERNFMELDPLSPRRCIPNGKFVACLSQELLVCDLAGQRYKEEFAKHHRLADALEITLNAGENLFLGCSLLRHQPLHEFTRQEIGIAQAFKQFAEFALVQIPRIHQMNAEEISRRFPSLTPREALMAKYVAFGLSNKQLSQELNISLATVKTHLLNIFGKLGIRNRTELAARLFS